MDDKRIADYFIISGISDNPEFNTESKQLIGSILPITDVTVIFRGLGEKCPPGFTCIERTPGGHQADLNNGNFNSPNIQICYRRGTDKPPLIEIGVCHEDKERVLPDIEVVYTTPYGRCASTGNSGSKSGTYITYRRAKTDSPFNQLVVVDLCVILNNKGEYPPHAFYAIKKNLNKSIYGMIGSEVFLCYKKTLLSPPSLCYKPQIISRFPLEDYFNFPLPQTVPLFCLPTGANIELWPENSPLPRPMPTTFVLTTDSAQKIYGSALSFYEPFDQERLTDEQKERLGIVGDKNVECQWKSETFVIKSICILSRWPFFDCFEKFLVFLHRLVFSPIYPTGDTRNTGITSHVPLEHHISHFLLDVSFPTPQRPTVMVQLMPGTDETVIISQPSSRLPLPLTGASFVDLLLTLGVDNTMNVLLYGLSEQKILLHSLKPFLLTGMAEAISAMLFPFHWQCPYVPLCPLSLHGILNAPVPFIAGIDSRCFDTFTPPEDIICIDLDTKAIFLSELKRCLNLRILPKRASRVLRSSLEKIFVKLTRTRQTYGLNLSPQHKSLMPEISQASLKTLERKLDLEIQEAFIRFMVTILRGFRTYLLPITQAPTVGTTDPTSLFDFEGFLASRDRNYNLFYQLITKTQMFTHYIEERSFVSDKDTSLAFFDDCEEKLVSSGDIFSDRPIKLFDKEDGIIQTDRSVYIPAPEQSPSLIGNSENPSNNVKRKLKFGPLNSVLFHRHPQINKFSPIDHRALNNTTCLDNQFLLDNLSREPNSSFSISRRTKQEIKASQKSAKKSSETPLEWSKYLVSCCYSLWFATLPSYIAYCKVANRPESNTTRILRYAYSSIDRMQKLNLSTDEICFRVLTLLCGHYGQPALAVRVFVEMRKAGIKPNAVTYGYYNKAVLESKWPDNSRKPTTILWAKIRNVITGVALFKSHGKLRKEKRDANCMYLMGDPSFSRFEVGQNLDVVDRATQHSSMAYCFRATALPIEQEQGDSKYNRNQHRRSLVNRSFSAYPKENPDIDSEKTESKPNLTLNKNAIHKSYSMHLRDGSPERSLLARTKSSSDDDDDDDDDDYADDEPPVVAKHVGSTESNAKRVKSLEAYKNLRERYQLMTNMDELLTENLDLVDNIAGIIFTTNPAPIHPPIQTDLLGDVKLDTIHLYKAADTVGVMNQQTNFLRNSTIVNQNEITDANEFLKTNSFGEDAQILKKIDSRNQKPNLAQSVECLGDDLSSEDNKSNKLSESIAEPPESLADPEDLNSLKNITSTPNFKLARLINDASNMQWSRWTSSQNSKSVYKGIKSAATGIVSSLQEIKSSFTISNNNTPSKFNSTLHRSTATRDMLSQMANYFSSQPERIDDDDSDNSSLGSNDLLGLSNEEDIDPSSTETNDLRRWRLLFDALERHYNNSSPKEDLLNHLTDESDVEADNVIAIDVRMTTCSRCNVCRSLLYDEEIMERWSHNESNLNTKCIYCRAKIVPLMSISVIDRRFSSNDLKQVAPKNSKNLVDLSSDSDDAADEIPVGQCPPNDHVKRAQYQNQQEDNQQCFTVPYLSPIVLRKELESVFESSGDNCPSNSNFVDEHPIIFWNLLWYYSRINMPTHLALLCLNAKSILNGREVPEEKQNLDKVVVRTLWDNEKLHSEIGKPLYRLYERGDPSIQVQAVLCDELYFSRSFLERVIDSIAANELGKAMNLILNARLKSSISFSFDKHRHNLYRDLIFLLNKALGPGKLHADNFEREYKRAFDNLSFQQVALNRFDRPPTIGSIFCRKSFKELGLSLSAFSLIN